MTADRALDILAMSEQARWKDGIEPEDVKKAVETIRKAQQSKGEEAEGVSNTLTLNNPLTDSDWDKICDVEFEKTEHIWYITPSGKRVDFIKSDVLDMIKAELETNTEKWWYGENSGDCFVKLSYVLEIIDNCRKSVIEGVSE